MIRIYTQRNSPRLQYIAGIIFDTLLRVGHEIIVPENVSHIDTDRLLADKTPIVFYGISSNKVPSIPSQELLFEDHIADMPFPVTREDFPHLHFPIGKPEGYTVDFDLFSAAFYLITSYYDYQPGLALDAHGRYDERANPLFANGDHVQPLVDLYAAHLWDKLTRFFPWLHKPTHLFDYKISFDIDSPWLYKNKGMLVTSGSLLKNMIRFWFKNLWLQIKTLLGGHDPYDVFDEIMNTVPKGNLIFFFLLDSHHPNDTRITYKNASYRALIKRIYDRGIATGIHPSYTSFKNKDQIAFETNRLADITSKPVDNARMHFLRYNLPETMEYLIEAGIRNDYTFCPLYKPGFKNFISRPFPWFNLAKNCETKLMVHPTMVMDRGLQKYMALNPDEAWLQIKAMIDTTRAHKGTFTILFHNNSLSETAEWQGWKTVFEKTVAYLA